MTCVLPHVEKLQTVRWERSTDICVSLKERHEAVVRRTMERSQKPRQKHNRWSWGGPLHGSPGIHTAGKHAETSVNLFFTFFLHSMTAFAYVFF
jgi:hypothetical protein